MSESDHTDEPLRTRKPIIYLVSLDVFHPVDVKKLATLLSKQTQFSVRQVAIDAFRLYEINPSLPPFFQIQDIAPGLITSMREQFSSQQLEFDPQFDFVVAITATRIRHNDSAASIIKLETDPDPDAFGVFDTAPASPYFNVYVLSTYLMDTRYYRQAYRSYEQYAAVNIITFLLDHLFNKITTHYDTRWDIFDANPDSYSFVRCLKVAQISDKSRYTLLDAGLRSAYRNLSIQQILSDAELVLAACRKPPIWEVLRYFGETPLYSIFLFGFVLALAINVLSAFISSAQMIAGGALMALGIVLFGFLVKERFFPTGPLRH